jgi:outer membrane immunogenic protein
MNATQGLRASMIAALLMVVPAGAFAADLPVRGAPGGGPGPGGPPPIPFYNWSGFYIGGNFGAGWESSNLNEFDPVFGGGTSISHSQSGAVGGGQIGYNWQLAPSWLIGVEWLFDGADIRTRDIDPTLTLLSDSKTDWLTTVTGRLGYTINNWLFYGKGGGGWVHESYTFTELGVGGVSTSDTTGGWVAGAGIEYGITPNWTIRLDYTHIGLDDRNAQGPFSAFDTVSISRHLDLLTAGVNFKF